VVQQLYDDMRLLAEVQGFDKVIQKLGMEKDEVPPGIVAIRQEIGRIEKEVAEMENELENLRKERRQKERELDEKLESLGKYRAQKNQVKTNEAYSALLKEIQDVETEKFESEENVLVFMERAEELTRLIGEKKGRLAKCGEELVSMEEENKKRVEQLEKELLKYTEERNLRGSKVNSDLLSRYEKIKKAKDGLAFVAVRNNTCQGCFMELPPQVVSELMKRDKIITCERCSRLLYWEEK